MSYEESIILMTPGYSLQAYLNVLLGIPNSNYFRLFTTCGLENTQYVFIPGYSLQADMDVGVYGSSAGTASRFSSFEEPGQFVRIPMSDFDEGLDEGMPDLLRQVS